MNWRVEIDAVNMTIDPAKTLNEPFAEWLSQQGQPYKWLLAHTYDGVVWGRLDADGWQLSTDKPIDTNHLLELRLFCETKECYLWRDGTQLKFRIITDEVGDTNACYLERRMLWGTDGEDAGNGFTKLWDGSQGMEHTVPIPLTHFNGNGRPAQLVLRHYIEKEKETGLARVTISRLQSVEENNGS